MYVEREIAPSPDGRQRTVYVYELPVRLWHWVNAVAILVLAVTGYLIGNPAWPAVSGEASQHFLMGYVRFTHFSAAYVFAIGLLGRLYWAFAGNRHAHQLVFVPLSDRDWWRGVVFQLRWYFFIEPAPKHYLGHDPLAQLVMVLFFTLPAGFMVLTGFALYSEGAGGGGWGDRLFGWVIPLFGQSQAVHSWHRIGAWLILTFVIIHLYAALREEIMARRSILNSMVTGYRTFRD